MASQVREITEGGLQDPGAVPGASTDATTGEDKGKPGTTEQCSVESAKPVPVLSIEPCQECGAQTDFVCADCGIERGTTQGAHVCPSCFDAHETSGKCGAQAPAARSLPVADPRPVSLGGSGTFPPEPASEDVCAGCGRLFGGVQGEADRDSGLCLVCEGERRERNGLPPVRKCRTCPEDNPTVLGPEVKGDQCSFCRRLDTEAQAEVENERQEAEHADDPMWAARSLAMLAPGAPVLARRERRVIRRVISRQLQTWLLANEDEWRKLLATGAHAPDCKHLRDAELAALISTLAEVL